MDAGSAEQALAFEETAHLKAQRPVVGFTHLEIKLVLALRVARDLGGLQFRAAGAAA